jgi:hypothetical protein
VPVSELLDESLSEAVARRLRAQCIIAWTDIFGSRLALEFGLFHELSGLFSCCAEE